MRKMIEKFGKWDEGRRAAAQRTHLNPQPPALNSQPSTLNPQHGFTLIELLIVTVVVVMLMAVLFRLTGIAGDASKRETTVQRMQKLENCLSGYFATFGSYPPVPLQGATRNIYRKVSEEHLTIQSDDQNDIDDSSLDSDRVDAACKAQPVAAMYPPPRTMPGTSLSSADAYNAFQQAVQAAYDADAYSDSAKKKIEKWKDATILDIGSSPGFLNSYQPETDITRLQLFRYGLMSFLLPRYRFMLLCAKGSQSGNAEAFNNAIDRYKQWTDFNPLPPRMDTGIAYTSWKDFCNEMGGENDWQIDLIPSQAACARWMPNLKDIVSGPDMTFFGVNVGIGNNKTGIPDVDDAAGFTLYSPGGRDSSSASGYPLLSLTVKDGWGHDFYYYSPPPHQTYVLWSAGANGLTFPPWVDLEQFRQNHSDQYVLAVQWMADDVKFMSTGK